MHTVQQTHTHKTVVEHVEAKGLLSRRRQSDYKCLDKIIYLRVIIVISNYRQDYEANKKQLIEWKKLHRIGEIWLYRNYM